MTKGEVGEFAGMIWHLLSERGCVSVRKIGEVTSWKESRIFLALGWLAREEKIVFKDQHDMLYVELKN